MLGAPEPNRARKDTLSRTGKRLAERDDDKVGAEAENEHRHRAETDVVAEELQLPDEGAQ